MTREEMAVDFFRHVLLDRYIKAKHDGLNPTTLEELLADESFEEGLAAFDRQLEEEAKNKKVIREAAVLADDRETLSSFRAPQQGSS